MIKYYLGGEEMNYEIIYSKRKTLCLQITNDLRIVVRSPHRVSKASIDDFVNKHSDWIEKKIAQMKSRPAINELSCDDIEALKKNTEEIIAPRISYYSNLMGLSPNKISISSAKKRFGSCSSQGNINFSFRLALYPQEATEYVIVHELAHLKEMNHSKKFWQIVEKYMPDYKERRKLLR